MKRSHIKILEKNNVNIENVRDNNVKTILSNLKTISDKELSDNYKIAILHTLREANENITKMPKQLNLKTTRSKEPVQLEIKQLVLAIIKDTYNLDQRNIDLMSKRSIVEAYICILIVTSCMISIEDVFGLTIEDLETLRERRSLRKIKKILTNDLFTRAIPIIERLLIHRRTLISESNNLSYDGRRLITCSPSLINKTLKYMCQETSTLVTVDKKVFKSIGLSKFKFEQPSVVYEYVTDDD